MFDFVMPNVKMCLLPSRLLQLHDRNSRRQFTPPEDFHARQGVDDYFVAQVCTRASLELNFMLRCCV